MTTIYNYILCKFRTSDDSLPILKEKWYNTDRNERNCLICQIGDVGDEYHCIYVSPA